MIMNLVRRRERILEAANIDLDALSTLVADYVAANMHCAAAKLQRKLNWY